MDLLEALSAWPIAAFLRQSGIAYPLVNAAHILSLSLVVGAIVTLDLRILGLFRPYRLSMLGPPLSQMAAWGVVGAAVTGFLLFSTRPSAYLENPAFLTKIGLVSLGFANAVVLRRTRSWRRALDDEETDARLRIGAALSLAIWVSAVVAGRWIGFLQ